MEYPPLTDYVQPDGLAMMYSLMDYRERVAEAERTGIPIARIRKEDAAKYGIPF